MSTFITPDAANTLKTVALIGTHLPRRCGIATFTHDLSEALEAAAPQVRFRAVALDDRPEGYRYPPRVWFEINQPRLGEHRLAADFLNLSQVDVACVQHEYGIYGGNDGGYVVEFLKRLRIPSVVTMHTVLRDPTPSQREVTLEMAEVADRLVVLSERGQEFLRDIYEIPEQKICFIPHGIPNVPFIDPNYFKDQFGVMGRKVLLTFGLLSPDKGVENMIEAMPHIVAKHPEAVYIVLGATHPAIRAEHGESYRMGLLRRVEELNLRDHVVFHNRFVELQELCEFLGAADVYVTPYLNEAQIVSGTLAYALGAGKATVSTPYWYAEEMLADGRGRLTPFNDTKAMAEQIADLFDNEVERHTMRKRAYDFTRCMLWKEVANSYLGLFEQVRAERESRPRPATTTTKPQDEEGEVELPEINLDHLRALTDDCGIIQHARGTLPDRDHGYCVDDNARALIVALIAADYAKEQSTLTWLTNRYLAFLVHAFNEDTGRFRNFMSYDRGWLEEVGSEDSHGRSLWAVAEAVARCQTRGQLTPAINLIHRAMPVVEKFTSPRSWAYSIIGIHAYLRRFGGDNDARRIREKLALQLFDRFEQSATHDWPWFEDIVTYANARVPHALLLSGKWLFHDRMIERALESLDWLWKVQSRDGHFAPVGCHGWYPRGGEKAHFDQQPIEATCMIDALVEAYHVTQDRMWIRRAYRTLNWFLGANDLSIPIYDYKTGGCFDGLHSQGVNENQGAESTLAWLLSLLSLYDHAHDGTLKKSSTGKPAKPSEGAGVSEGVMPTPATVQPVPTTRRPRPGRSSRAATRPRQ